MAALAMTAGSLFSGSATSSPPLTAFTVTLPVGNVTVKAVKGGLDVADPENNDPAVIASAAIAVRIEVR